MSGDESDGRVRQLLLEAVDDAGLPAALPPETLLAAGRRRRRGRVAATGLALVLVVAAAVGLPLAVLGSGAGGRSTLAENSGPGDAGFPGPRAGLVAFAQQAARGLDGRVDPTFTVYVHPDASHDYLVVLSGAFTCVSCSVPSGGQPAHGGQAAYWLVEGPDGQFQTTAKSCCTAPSPRPVGHAYRLRMADAPTAVVPNVLGDSQGAATAALEAAGFTVTTAAVDSTAPAGTVVAQSPAGGRRAQVGSAVSLNVAGHLTAAPRSWVGSVTALSPRLCVGRHAATGHCFTGASPAVLSTLTVGDCVVVTFTPATGTGPATLDSVKRVSAKDHSVDCPTTP